MSAPDASDSDSDHEVEVTTDFQTETVVQPPGTNPMTQEGLREDFTELFARLSRESLEREERFRQQQLVASEEQRALLGRLQQLERGLRLNTSHNYDQNAFDPSAIDPSNIQHSTPLRTASGRSSRQSRAGPPLPSPILPSSNPGSRRSQTRPVIPDPRVSFIDPGPQTPRSQARRPLTNVTHVTTPSLFVIPKPIVHLSVPSIMALNRAYERHMARPGNACLVIYLYAVEYFSVGVLDYIENNLNTYYGGPIANLTDGDAGMQAPSRDELEQMEPAELFEEIYKCFVPANKKDMETKLGQVVASSVLEKPCSSWSMNSLPYWQMTIEHVIKNTREFLIYVPEQSSQGRSMPYHGGLRPNVPLGLKGLVQVFVKDWFSPNILSALRDTFTVPERQMHTLTEWINDLEKALWALRKAHNPISQITKACSEADRERRSRQTTKNINETSLNTIMSEADLDVLQATLCNIDDDLDYQDSVDRGHSESIKAIDTRRPNVPSPGVKTSEGSADQVCFRTVQGTSCDPKKCTYSHEPSRIRKFLVESLALHDSKHKQSFKAIAAEELELEPGSQFRKPEAVGEADQEEEE